LDHKEHLTFEITYFIKILLNELIGTEPLSIAESDDHFDQIDKSIRNLLLSHERLLNCLTHINKELNQRLSELTDYS